MNRTAFERMVTAIADSEFRKEVMDVLKRANMRNVIGGILDDFESGVKAEVDINDYDWEPAQHGGRTDPSWPAHLLWIDGDFEADDLSIDKYIFVDKFLKKLPGKLLNRLEELYDSQKMRRRLSGLIVNDRIVMKRLFSELARHAKNYVFDADVVIDFSRKASGLTYDGRPFTWDVSVSSVSDAGNKFRLRLKVDDIEKLEDKIFNHTQPDSD